jgi:hypothetical protein
LKAGVSTWRGLPGSPKKKAREERTEKFSEHTVERQSEHISWVEWFYCGMNGVGGLPSSRDGAKVLGAGRLRAISASAVVAIVEHGVGGDLVGGAS